MTPITSGLVSTIIPVFNRAGMLRRGVHSVLAQHYRPIEIIIVDDGSTDETPRVAGAIAESNPGLVRVLHQRNSGPGPAREAGRQAARGEFIQYLDSDDWLLPAKFDIQVDLLRRQPECGIAYGVTRLVDEHANTLLERSKRTGERRTSLFPTLLVERWWHTSTPLFRRAVTDAAGPWPHRRPEDWDLEARMGARGVKLAYSDRVVSCHCEHPGAHRVSQGERAAYLKDEAWFLPRLFECACKAGVRHDSPEMQVFARWAFMRCRYLAALGEERSAVRLLALARQAGTARGWSLKAVELSAGVIGWRATGKLCAMRDRIKDRWTSRAA